MKKLTLTALSLAALSLPLAASASTLFTFDPTGTAGSTGDITALATLDQAVGNALSVGGTSTAVGSSTRLLYQANLDTVKDANGAIKYTDGSVGGTYFTFVAGFSEIVTSNSDGTVKFKLDTSQPTFFNMYATTAAANNLTGTGFTSNTLILSGTIGSTGFSSNFSADLDAFGNPNIETFDQAGIDNYSGKQSITGAGATKINTTINYVNSLYFPTFSANSLVMSFVNTSQVLPFGQVDPSAAFSTDGVTSANYNARIGDVNGISGPDFQFQADANSSFTVAAVPEPGSLALVGMGLTALGFVGRRRKANQR